MKDHEIIAKIGALLDGADAPTRATVEAWLRAKLLSQSAKIAPTAGRVDVVPLSQPSSLVQPSVPVVPDTPGPMKVTCRDQLKSGLFVGGRLVPDGFFNDVVINPAKLGSV